MTPEEQCIEIAKFCGWRSCPYCIINNVRNDIETWLNPQELSIGFSPEEMPSGSFAGRGVPDYLNDLNAMHEAEKTLTQAQYEDYASDLYFARWSLDKKKEWNCDHPISVSSPAYVRAEIFLKTIGKWKDISQT